MNLPAKAGRSWSSNADASVFIQHPQVVVVVVVGSRPIQAALLIHAGFPAGCPPSQMPARPPSCPGRLIKAEARWARFMLSRLFIKHGGYAKASSCAPAARKLHRAAATNEQLLPARLRSAGRLHPVDETADQR